MWESENTYQRILENALADVPYEIAANVVCEKLNAQGVQPTEPERQQLVDHLKSGNGDQWSLLGQSVDARVRVEITDADNEVISERIDEFMSEHVPRIVSSVGEKAAET